MPRPRPEILVGSIPLISTPCALAHVVNASCSAPGGDTFSAMLRIWNVPRRDD